jgi:hypothetical protein
MRSSQARRLAGAAGLCLSTVLGPQVARAATIDLTAATIVVPRRTAAPREADGPASAERLAATVLREEIEQRTGRAWTTADEWPAQGPVVAIVVGSAPGWRIPDSRTGGPADSRTRGPGDSRTSTTAAGARAEGYRLVSRVEDGRTVVWIVATDQRGALFGVGHLLRTLSWRRGAAALSGDLDVTTAPRYPIRGHQLGYRHHSNTYDGWTEAQYDQYVRELVLFGANAIENIPFQDTRVSPLMPISRDAMNRRLSAVCKKYGVQYWLWAPADFDLGDAQKRAEALASLDALFADLPRLDAIFLPGGDPGDNAAALVVPYLADIASRLKKRHPAAQVWLSLQNFDKDEIDFLFTWIDRDRPDWLGGLVAGPGSHPIPETRQRLDRRYQLRDYPDITHTVRSQYPVPWWDPAFNFTLGREPVNPRPVFYAKVHDLLAPYTDGFISYSDGVNDDFNKAVWTRKGWDPEAGVRDIALDYARLFFGGDVAERAADGILALERNWEGPLATNGAVDASLALWREVEAAAPMLETNWRWQMHLMRAYYDAYTRHRLIHESRLESEALDRLASAPRLGSSVAMDSATAVLARATTDNCCPPWRKRIEALCDALFSSIRMQTSIPKHSASGAERGAVLDFVDHPLNNRWWLEDQLAEIRRLPDEAQRQDRLVTLATWSRPGPGSFYDDVGNVAASPHVLRGDSLTPEGLRSEDPIPHFTWEGGPTRTRLSWLTSLRWPKAIVYTHLDPSARYVVRLNVITPKAPGQVRLRIDGQPAEVSRPARARGELFEFAVPPAALADGTVTLTFDDIDESALNWRQHSRLVEAWMIRQ